MRCVPGPIEFHGRQVPWQPFRSVLRPGRGTVLG